MGARNARAVQAAMKANVAALSSKIDAARKSASAAIRGANAASAARQVTVLTTLKTAMAKAQRRANAKFGKVYRRLAKDRARADAALGGAVNGINDGLAKQAALADARFSRTVKDIGAARRQAAKQVSDARKAFTTSMYRVTSEVKDLETRLSGEIAVVSGEVVSNRAAQMRVNRRTSGERRRITKLANDRHSASVRARGKLRKLLDENKRAAAQEVKALAASTKRAVAAVRSQAARNAQDAAKDLTRATRKMYSKMANMQARNNARNRRNSRRIASYSARARAELFHAKKAASKKDRALIKAQTEAMTADLNKKLVRSI